LSGTYHGYIYRMKPTNMRILFALCILFSGNNIANAQQQAPAKNLIIFLMDGYRWRELYRGADSSIIFDNTFNHTDSAWTVEKYWDPNMAERRRKLMPFVWETFASQGQMYGDRDLGNLVNVKNTYWFSYPGRSEAFTGYFDSAVNSNEYPDNPNTNVLEFINDQPDFHGKLAVFSSWDAVARILNRNRNGIMVNIYGEDVKGSNLTDVQKAANQWQHLLPDLFGKGERMDGATYAMAKPYLLANHPRILYIDLGDNDDFGHAGEYGDYLDAAHYADAMFRDLWTTIQQDPFYKDKTDIIVFPDHGRGIGPKWTSHGSEVPYSDETYLLAMGPGIAPKGLIKTPGQIYQQQYAQTIAALLGFHFTATHPVAPSIPEVVNK
jgi:hypothetical protein